MEIVSTSEIVRRKKGEAHSLHDTAGDRCSCHPDVDAVDTCSCCGKPVCYVCAVETVHGIHCEACADEAGTTRPAEYRVGPAAEPSGEVSEAAQPRDADKSPGRRKSSHVIEWENRDEVGRQKALFSTWLTIVFRPARFFRHIHPDRGYLGPLLYGAVWILLGLAGGLIWKMIIWAQPMVASLIVGETIELSLHLSWTQRVTAAALVLSPVLAVVFLAAVSAAFHLLLTLFTREHSGYRATFRVFCYSAGAYVFFLVPTVGGLIAGAWQTMLMVVGLKQAHRIPASLSVATAFAPCAMLFAAGLAYSAWAVAGSSLDLADLIGKLFASLAG